MADADHHPRNRGAAVVTALLCALLFGVLVFAARELKLESPASHRAQSLLKLDSALGATLEPLDREAAEMLGGGSHEDEMVVTSVAAGGRAEAAGLQVGDVIEKVDGTSPTDLDAAIDAVSTDPTEIVVNRHGNRAMVRVAAQGPALHS